MDDMYIFLIVLLIGCFLAGPVALIIAITALKRINAIRDKLFEILRPQIKDRDINTAQTPRPAQVVKAPEIKVPKPAGRPEPLMEKRLDNIFSQTKTTEGSNAETTSIEQQIGTKWILIAGIIAVIFGVGFFLKYAYDNAFIGPEGRVIIATLSGIAAISIGEITRRRNYEIVAKAVTALGFAILYTTAFSAYRVYGLINSPVAFIAAIIITIAAMSYAVKLNEITIAILSLLGGYLTPVIISTGENLPAALFTYVLILSCGAMLCAYWRKWQIVNFISFFGTFLLYAGWFEKFFRPELNSSGTLPQQTNIAIGWLCVFFAIHLALPMLYGLVRKTKVRAEDIILVLLNALIVLFYLCNILYDNHRSYLALSCSILCAIHLLMAAAVNRRVPDDKDSKSVLIAIGLLFATIAIPLYLKMYAVTIAWMAQAVILTLVGLKYKNKLIQFWAGIVYVLSIGRLLYYLPMHKTQFEIILNPDFGTWIFATVSILAGSVLYRVFEKNENKKLITQILYVLGCTVLLGAILMEWYANCRFNMAGFNSVYFYKGLITASSIFVLVPILKPLSPGGILPKIYSSILALLTSVILVCNYSGFHNDSFIAFINSNFAIAIIPILSLFAAGWLLKCYNDEVDNEFSAFFMLTAILVLWLMISQEIYSYWYFRNKYAVEMANWKFAAHMCVSIAWSVYGIVLIVIGFWRNKKVLRFMALGLFAILLLKIFIVDMATVKNVYRIAAFLVTGTTLVGISYLYQFLKKKGFFGSFIPQEQIKN